MSWSTLSALFGVILGFVLGEGSRLVQRYHRVREARRVVCAELRAALAQIPQKKDILSQAIEKMGEGKVLPTQSVHILTHGYESVLPQIYPHLTDRERTSLHVIYERLRVADHFMDNLESGLRDAIGNISTRDAWKPYMEKCIDLQGSYDIVEELIHAYLRGDPVDVFSIESKR